jgi:hypothetical protein
MPTLTNGLKTIALGDTAWREDLNDNLELLDPLLNRAVATKTANYTALVTDVNLLGDASGGAFMFTLPDPATCEGQPFTFGKIDSSSNAITLSGETINGESSLALENQWAFVTIKSDGTEFYVVSATAGAGSLRDIRRWTVNTTDASWTVLGSITLETNRAYYIHAEVLARRTGGTSGTAEDMAAYDIRGGFSFVSGAANLVGSNIVVVAEDQSAWDVDFNASGTAARIRVKGAAGNNVSWSAIVDVMTMSLTG